MKRILCTGGDGFIGKHLVAVLGDCEVLDLVSGRDIRTDALGEYDTIYHLAALRDAPNSFDDPASYFETNVYGTYRLLTEAKWRRFVNVSSSLAKTPVANPYGMSKFLAEDMAPHFENAITVRPHNVFGPGQTVDGPVVRNFCEAMTRGEAVTIHGDGSQAKDYTYVEDFVRQLIWYAENGPANGSFDAGYQSPVSVGYLFDQLSAALDYDRKPMYGPRRRGDVDWSMAEDPMTIEPIGLLEGLRRTAEWWRLV